jgi:hypothetical protein
MRLNAKDLLSASRQLERATAYCYSKLGQRANEKERAYLVQVVIDVHHQCVLAGLTVSIKVCDELYYQLLDASFHESKTLPLPAFESMYWLLRGIAERVHDESAKIHLAVADQNGDTNQAQQCPGAVVGGLAPQQRPPEAVDDTDQDQYRLTGESVELVRDGGSPRYRLREGSLSWALVFDGRPASLPKWKGVNYVCYLLTQVSGEAIHGTELAHRVFGEAVIEGQRNLAADDEELYRRNLKAKMDCQREIDDPDTNETMRKEAKAELEQIDNWMRKHSRGTEGPEEKQVRAIRASIRRVLNYLERSKDEVLRSFGEHLDRNLLQPSQRSRWGRNSRVRAGLAGRLVYIPPDGVKWSG